MVDMSAVRATQAASQPLLLDVCFLLCLSCCEVKAPNAERCARDEGLQVALPARGRPGEAGRCGGCDGGCVCKLQVGQPWESVTLACMIYQECSTSLGSVLFLFVNSDSDMQPASCGC